MKKIKEIKYLDEIAPEVEWPKDRWDHKLYERYRSTLLDILKENLEHVEGLEFSEGTFGVTFKEFVYVCCKWGHFLYEMMLDPAKPVKPQIEAMQKAQAEIQKFSHQQEQKEFAQQLLAEIEEEQKC